VEAEGATQVELLGHDGVDRQRHLAAQPHLHDDAARPQRVERADQRGVTLDARVADLELGEFIIEPDSYDLIVNCCYLQRDLFPAIKAGGCVGGLVIAVIAMVDDDPNVKPMNPAFLLQSNELRTEFAGWEPLHSFEVKSGEKKRAVAEFIARRV